MSINIDCTGPGSLTLKAAQTGEYTLVLPPTPGLSGQVLSTDGSGILSWITPPTGSGSTGSTTYPIATKLSAGDVIIGDGINVDSNGKISVPPGSYTLQPATIDNIGGVRGGGTGITIDSTGRISLSSALATGGASDYNAVQISYRKYNSTTFKVETLQDGTVSLPGPVPEMVAMTVSREMTFYQINFAKFWHMRSDEDCGPKLNEVMCAASDLIQQMTGGSFYGLSPNHRIRVYLPPGDYFLKTQVVVPSNVELDCAGRFLRYDSGELANTYIPAIALTPYAHLGNGQLICHLTSPDQDRGSGWITGKLFCSTAFQMTAAGSNYKVGDVLTLEQPHVGYSSDKSPFRLAQLRVTAVNATTGAITDWVVHRQGSYDRKLANVKDQGHYTRTLWDHDNSGSTGMQDISVQGRNARFKVSAYSSEFTGARYKSCDDGFAPFMQTHIGHMNAIEAGDNLDASGNMADNRDPTFGFKCGIQIAGKNIEINRLYTLRGRIGIWFRDGADARVNNINTVLSGTALQIGGFTSFTCHNAAVDSNQWMGLRLYGCSGVQMAIRIFWENGNDDQTNNVPNSSSRVLVKPHASGYAAKIGDTGSDGQLISAQDLRLQITNAGGPRDANGNPTGIGVYIDRLASSSVNIVYCNSEYSGRPDSRTKLLKTLIEYGTTKASSSFQAAPNDVLLKSSNRISGVVDGITGPLYTGNPHGIDMYIVDSAAGGVCRAYGVYELSGPNAPTGSTGKGKAKLGSKYTKTTGSAPWHYIQTNADQNFPTWAAA